MNHRNVKIINQKRSKYTNKEYTENPKHLFLYYITPSLISVKYEQVIRCLTTFAKVIQNWKK